MTALDGTRTSPISDISCHRSQNVCVVTTLNDGMAVISTNDQVTFLSSTSGNTWIGVDCADPTLNECVGFASGLKTQAIRIDVIDSSKSTVRDVEQFGTLNENSQVFLVVTTVRQLFILLLSLRFANNHSSLRHSFRFYRKMPRIGILLFQGARLKWFGKMSISKVF